MTASAQANNSKMSTQTKPQQERRTAMVVRSEEAL
jgi:hypothetical protein